MIMEKQNIPFTMNYNALKMFGRQLYSNAWAAISELVANGFDANAKNVFLYIDMKEKRNTTIELFDDGIGMNDEDLKSKYVRIGRNRRTENNKDTAAGRKGIGKLAALYLSDKYQIIIRKDNEVSAWSVDVSDMDDEDTPSLKPIPYGEVNIVCDKYWNSTAITHGTMIRLEGVDLKRIGEAAIDALKHKLSNYFQFDSIQNKLNVCIIKSNNDSILFEPVVKKIAFDNMFAIYTSDKNLVKTTKTTVSMSYRNKLHETKSYTKEIEINDFPDYVINPKTRDKFLTEGKIVIDGKEKNYKLTGWIGIHSSIDKDDAVNNDSRYVKNKFYNPNQIRVYVRGKLFNDSILSSLPLVGAFVNYIEGEIAFEILDENDLDDIATSNRQDFSFIDERVNLLNELLAGICRQLLQDRQRLADNIKSLVDEENKTIQSREKTTFSRDVYKELISDDTLPKQKANELANVIANKLKGEYDLKTSFKLFLSHASSDRIFTDFISAYLQKLGFIFDKDIDKTEIFYSSDGLNIDSLDPLSEIIKNMLIRDNTQILFLTSKNFLNSQYCLFEGGAAWATRSIGMYRIVSLDYESIPKFLTNGKPEFSFNVKNRDSFILDRQSYENLVKVLNEIIEHLNKNREVIEKPTVPLIPEVKFKDEVEMRKEGKTDRDYMDQDVLTYWETYIEKKIDKYIRDNLVSEK